MKEKKKFKIWILHTGTILFVLMHVLVVWISFHPEFALPPEEIENIFLTGAQIVAGLYGMILTAYVFLLGKIDGQIAMNPAAEDVILSLKEKYKQMIMLISLDVLFSFIGVGVSIYYQSGVLNMPEWIYWVITNETLLFMGCVIIFIVYFLNRAIHPRRMEQAAMELKYKVDKGHMERGDTREFLKNYCQIEDICYKKVQNSLQISTDKYSDNNFFVYKYMRQQKLFTEELCDQIELLRKYHSCLLFGDDLEVSLYICQLAKNVLKEIS